MKQFLIIALTCWLLPLSLSAYPPAPHHTLEGLVRNEQGGPIIGDNIKVVAVSVEGGRVISKVNKVYRPGINYSLNVPMESSAGRNLFKTDAFKQKMKFSLEVIIDGKNYLPIEMIGNTSKMGMPGETTFLDLTIGEDIDGDGLPDAWERGIASITGKSIEQIGPNDDSDGDGLSNLQEYISGSYAFDKNDGVIIQMKDISSDMVRFEFLAITGRTYSLEISHDFKEWKKTNFKLAANDDEESYSHVIATKVGNIEIDVPTLDIELNKQLFFKLKVQ
jgi:hypothetical protein